MSRLPRMLKRGLRQLGAPGLAGLLTLALAATLLPLAQRWEEQAQSQSAAAERLRAQLRQQRAAARVAGSVPEPAQTQAQWLQALPPAALRQQRLADLLEMGLRLGLVSTRSEHRLSVDANSGLERLRVTMPLSGGYGQLRQYIEAALRHDPALSLDSLKLRRSGPQSAEVEAELQWSLHGRSELAPAGSAQP